MARYTPQEDPPSNTPTPILLLLSAILLALFILRNTLVLLPRLLHPTPLPGIPYHKPSAHNLLGDVPSMLSHIKTHQGTFISYIIDSMRSLNAPLIQVFIQPLSPPLVVLADYREARDILVHRGAEFDRSPSLGELTKGLIPHHRVHLQTNKTFWTQRRLIQDLMTPSFLYNIAAPAIYAHAEVMVSLWREKTRIADGRPWAGSYDVNSVALDAAMAFAFGEGFRHSMTGPNLEAIRALGDGEIARMRGADMDEAVVFPKGETNEFVKATLVLAKTPGEVQGNPFPRVTWMWVNCKPGIRKATRVKEEWIGRELKGSVGRMMRGKEGVGSAVDHMVRRERELAGKDGKAPEYFSRVMKDEIFGFLFAGHETTSTTICWGLKFLADQPEAQTKLRAALQEKFVSTTSEGGKNPSIQDIMANHIPYLDATIEEILRCVGPSPVVDRQALCDTEVLGQRIPKGTIVSCLVGGPTMLTPGYAIDEKLRSPTSQAAKTNRRDRAWDPEDMALFKPERWINAAGEFDAASGPQLAFGLGTRGCFGKRLVYVEKRILLTLIVLNFELLPCPAALSSYKALLVTTHEPKQCYVRLREVGRGERVEVEV